MSRFERRFGRPSEAFGRAPGRVNLIGEHTDYNGGYVLPTVIPQETRVELAAVADRRVRVFTLDPRPEEAGFEIGRETPRASWIDYVQGVTRAIVARGLELGGFDAVIESAVPIGSGVSSSAALAVALQRALRERFELPLDDLDLARIAQQAENEFVGARVGIMDPMVSSLGVPGDALFVDTLDLSFRQVPIPRSIEIVVIDSGVAHRIAGGEYNRRREECEQAAHRLGVARLREVGIRDLPRIGALPEPLSRRARHVVTENQRVLEAVAALESDDPERLGALLGESHRSLRDDYQVSIEAVDRLVTILDAAPGVLGARITGGGFGGAVVAIARRGTGETAAASAAAAYGRATGNAGRVLVPPPATREPLGTSR